MSHVDTTAHINLCNRLNEVSLVGRVPIGALPATVKRASSDTPYASQTIVESKDRPSETVREQCVRALSIAHSLSDRQIVCSLVGVWQSLVPHTTS